MQRYQVVVNGNTYTVTVKSLVGSTAIVDVDGWEFQVAVTEENGSIDFTPVVAAATGASVGVKSGKPPVEKKPEEPTGTAKKRASALEQLTPQKSQATTRSGEGVIAAHLPGQIVEINVKVGDTVNKGDLVCKMEAMKMVNEVHSPKDGTVTEILVKESETVLENQPLMILE